MVIILETPRPRERLIVLTRIVFQVVAKSCLRVVRVRYEKDVLKLIGTGRA